MSYRAFKRLLGETSLERKCRFLFGGFILLLISASFWLYARQTESLAYEQIKTTGRVLVNQIVARQIATRCRTPDAEHPPDEARQTQALDEFRDQWEKHWPEPLRGYESSFIVPNATRAEHRPDDEYAQRKLKEFLGDPAKDEDTQLHLSSKQTHYYGAIRATKSCLPCHQKRDPDLQEGGLIAVVKVRIPTGSIEDGVHVNRALLICTAVATALLIMSGSYLIVRYVIVKPVKHLKEVADAISAGELNVRSEIQTGDEFEDLSHAFNRMLRTLVAMQDRLRKVNADLDRKVDELAQANLALYETNQLKSDFLATMSHELRTPLNSIIGFSDVLLSSDALTEKQQRWVRNIQSSGERLLNLINDILDLAKIEAGKMDVRLSEFNLHDVCEGLLTMFRPMAEKKNIDLRAHLDSALPPLRQDAGKIQQVLSNLLSNAVKFTPEGGKVVLKTALAPAEGTTSLDDQPRPRDLLLIVSDTGVGITPEEQGLIFEKFRQAANPMTREQGGTGLGLSITRELTKLLGGEVTLQSELGRGSTFTIRLPLRLSPEPRLEFDLVRESIDLSKAQRIDSRLYASPAPSDKVTG